MGTSDPRGCRVFLLRSQEVMHWLFPRHHTRIPPRKIYLHLIRIQASVKADLEQPEVHSLSLVDPEVNKSSALFRDDHRNTRVLTGIRLVPPPPVSTMYCFQQLQCFPLECPCTMTYVRVAGSTEAAQTKPLRPPSTPDQIRRSLLWSQPKATTENLSTLPSVREDQINAT